MDRLCLGMTALMAVAACGTPVSPAQTSPAGLWKTTIRPEDAGPVAIAVGITDDTVVSTQGEGTLDGTQLRLTFDDGARYVGTRSSQDAPVVGHYIQPANMIGGQAMAHPVTLSVSDDGQWAGQARPLAREFSLYINIAEKPDGGLRASLLNPQRNITGHSRHYDLTGASSGDRFVLTLPGNETEVLDVAFNRAEATLTMDFGPMQGLVFRPIERDAPEAIPYYGAKRSGLSSPAPGGDWPVGTVEDAGFRREALASLVARLSDVAGDEDQPALMHSLLVARGGELVVEEYFRGHARDEPHDTRSAGKTFASILVGALIHDGSGLSADTAIGEFIAVPNETQGAPITLGDLLTHRSGLECYDGDNRSAGNEDRMWQQTEFPNFWDFTAGLQTVSPPSTRYAYCSGGINLVGAAIAGSSGESVLSALQTRVLDPLGFKNAYWNVMPNGDAYFGGGAYLRSRDLLKIGQLYLDGGVWRGQRLVDADWIAESVKPQAAITAETTGLDEEAFNRFYFGGTDGYAWHLHDIVTGGQTYKSYEASGNGGQMVVIVPELDLVVAMTGGNYMEGFIWGQWRQEVIGNTLIPALKR